MKNQPIGSAGVDLKRSGLHCICNSLLLNKSIFPQNTLCCIPFLSPFLYPDLLFPENKAKTGKLITHQDGCYSSSGTPVNAVGASQASLNSSPFPQYFCKWHSTASRDCCCLKHIQGKFLMRIQYDMQAALLFLILKIEGIETQILKLSGTRKLYHATTPSHLVKHGWLTHLMSGGKKKRKKKVSALSYSLTNIITS